MADSFKKHSIDGDRYFIGESRNGATLYLGPITRDQANEVGIKGDGVGYHVCEIDQSDPIGGLAVLGTMSSPEAAYRLAEMLGLSTTSRKIDDFDDPVDLF